MTSKTYLPGSLNNPNLWVKCTFVFLLFSEAIITPVHANCFPDYSEAKVAMFLADNQKLGLRDYLVQNYNPSPSINDGSNSQLIRIEFVASELTISLFNSLSIPSKNRNDFIESVIGDITNDLFLGMRAACNEVSEGASINETNKAAREATEMFGGTSDYYLYLV